MEKLKNINTAETTDWTTEKLAAKRHVMDPLADKTVAAIMAKKEVNTINHLFESIVLDQNKLPDDAPEELRDFFKQSAILPEWADQDLINMGQQIYLRHGIWIGILLCYKSLPECYACANGAEVLHRTARLNENHGSLKAFSRRIAETAQFVVFSMSPDGLDPKGKGLIATQKVRLIHAVIRYYLKEHNWDAEKYGEPINQEDLAGTLMSFSALVIEGLGIIGIEFEPVELEAYIHCWRVIGHIVGLDDDMIPINSADALKLGHSILDKEKAPSEQAKALTKALRDFQNLKSKPILGEDSNTALMRLMMGDEVSDLLAVPSVSPEKITKMKKRMTFLTKIGEVLDKSLVFSMVLQFFTKFGLLLLLRRMSNSSIINFYLPKSLTQDWRARNQP
ncbi:oxygenase MpaB family protein [Algoriphagus chordae]|uniref:oxygenase MpaB family protein n=1 Tax=Algoriphagus chordae TaxID=237019 RepID=UPI0013147AC2|nr:oxygenase MpaB family protein [Algoriphagus chordae]